MNISTISYWFFEAFESMRKNMKNVLISVTTMIATMLIVAFGYLLVVNTIYIVEQVQEISAKVVCFLELDVTEKEVSNIETRLKGIDGVTEVKYITKEETTNQAIELGENYTYAIEEKDLKTMFPTSFIVTFETVQAEKEIIDTLKSMDGVGKNPNDIRVTASAIRIIKIANTIRAVAITAMILVIELSIFLMMNTTKLMLYARRKEISIMKYVGAKDNFIKIPFAIEGMIMALIAIFIVFLIISLCYAPIVEMVEASSRVYKCISMEEVMPKLQFILLIIGVGIGIFGSTMSMNKYLDV